ncbi:MULTISPECIES: hypothetical protein [Stenotrophomonas]|jgi:hypothetical protein|uniref:hypothetical protein n=1 Tax=Stenotrophomonas TaxID=40323 RepID=UPI00201CC6BD|nr:MULTISPECIES: hypothetical protein [Stenotrophomonas]MBN5024197.1 hypothetical protein [Stenotrophomonas maltophilia]MDH1271864.1 hypothetical protein [Stenotrophomonas sp. GD03937]MDH1483866.1 hypothetical protein [Stenotrophomonas sp. GD03712]UQY94782.1 hypothetical protein LZ605_16855 [Stenotrophomonas maltophilia]WON68519.1 hypothetical protein RWT08_20310 [Stenotrophomonas maltophilia]
MLLRHPVGMAQHHTQSPLFGIRGPGRPRQALSVAPAIDLRAEYQFWQVYERVVQPLPGGGLRLAWLVCQKVYRDRWQYPHDSDEVALSRVVFGGNMTADRASELAELHALVSRRVAVLAKRGRLGTAA